MKRFKRGLSSLFYLNYGFCIDQIVCLYYNKLMKEKRYFYPNQLQNNLLITLEGEEFHHLSNVMRSRAGDRVCLFNGNGNFYFGEIKSIEKKSAKILIDKTEESQNEPKINLTVFQALAKGDKLSLITQKITEIGASNLCLFESKYTDVKSNTSKSERLETIAISAAKQCGRATITKIEKPISIEEISKRINSFDKFYVAYENEDGKTLVQSLESNKNITNIAVMIGAEGGFSEKEISALKANGAEIVSLGKRILRTETAAILTTSLIMQILEN